MNTIKNEPVMVAAIAPIVAAFVGGLVAFGVDLTPEQQQAATTGVIALISLAALVANWLARQRVTPVADPHNNDGEALVTQAEADAGD